MMLWRAIARASRRPRLVFADEEKNRPDQLRQPKTAAFREVQRAQILWRYHAGETVSQISRALSGIPRDQGRRKEYHNLKCVFPWTEANGTFATRRTNRVPNTWNSKETRRSPCSG
ncbi:hypothetical protein SBA3_670011 [Candidatus Sulfopaludibacter sp. SbA3]|nr:hypothetical protein SBA3_670011 [Candidatus Sulfopaludibacter sp. SbA3]